MRLSLVATVSAIVLLCGVPAPSTAQTTQTDRGAYLAAAGGCISCHTDFKKKGKPFAGGAALKTPFGAFYAPNITPDKEHGIGNWGEADFIRAMREGVAPDGSHYFPVFPYPAFTQITEPDLKAMYRYFMGLAPVPQPNRSHEVGFPFSWRFLQTGWKLLFFEPGAYTPDPQKSETWNRGAYLVRALSHCGECHTPRNFMGALDEAMWMAGVGPGKGPEGEAVPNITPDTKTGIGGWGADEIAQYLTIGMDPDGDFAGSLMATVIEHGTGKMTEADIAAIVTYLADLPAIANKPK